MKKSYDVAVVGEIFTDHIFTGFAQWPQPGEEVFASGYAREVGGGTAITACSLARLGRSVVSVGVVGKEDEWCRSRLESFGVVTDALMVSDSLDTAVTISVSTSEDRSFFTWPGANVELPEMLSRPGVQKTLLAARHVHFAMRLERSLAFALLPLLRKSNCSISIDPGFHTQWYQVAENLQTLREFDYFFPNEKEGYQITGCKQPQQILAGLLRLGIHGAVVKLGRRGAAAVLDDKLLQALPPEMQAVDTTGAGDAFDAGFIDSILDSSSLELALRRGCACGALSTRAVGALAALPTIEETEGFYERVRIEVSHVK